MSRPLLVIIGGAPASGKTTLGRRLAAEFRLPYIGKDDIKETLYDTLGTGDRDWSRRLGSASVSLLYLFVEIELRAGRSVIAECNFDARFAVPELRALIDRYDALPLEILCLAEPDVLRARYQQRAETGERHAGHLDHLIAAELPGRIGEYRLLSIGGESMVLDTTDLAAVDYGRVARRLQQALEQASARS
jgi:predicted kinase